MAKMFLLLFIITLLLQFKTQIIRCETLRSDEVESLVSVLDWSSMEMAYQTQRKRNLRIYARNYPPIMAIIGSPKSERVKYKGIAVDLAEYISLHLDLKIEYVAENLSHVEMYGSVQAIINALINKEVDLSLNGMTPSPERVKIIDMTSPVIYDDFKIMVKWPEEMNRWTEVARPFHAFTWLMIALSFLVLIGMMTLLIQFYGNPKEKFLKTLNNSIIYVVAIIANQGQLMATGNSRFSLRILLGIWLLMMVVLINAYTGTLTSHMTAPKLKPIPQSLEELANRKDEYQITIMQNYLLAESFLNATSGTYKILGDTLREHPNLVFKEFSEATGIVLNQKGANVESSVVIAFRIVNDLKLNGKCRMTASDPISHVQSVSAALTKDSPFTKIIDTETRRALETGLFDVWKKNHVPNMDICKLENQGKGRKPTAITFVQLSSAFLILGTGLSLAFFSFLIENFLSHIH